MKPPLIANLSLLFSDLPMEQRFRRAADYGFSQVEIQFPYEWPAEQLKAWADAAGVCVYLINVPAGELLSGGHSLSCHPQYRAEFRQACERALAYGRKLGVSRINVLASNLDADDEREVCLQTYVDNLRYAGDLMQSSGIRICFEAINAVDFPHYLVSGFEQMLDIFEQVNHPNVSMQYDLYHMAMMHEDIPGQLERYADAIGHIQFADVPGRGAPGSGHLDFDALFSLIESSRYTGVLAAEYKISGDELADYGWLSSVTVGQYGSE